MVREYDVQPDDRMVFLHIPKTAGITFSTLIHPLLAELPWCPAITQPGLAQVPYETVARSRLFTGHFPFQLLTGLLPAGFEWMTFLRDPVSRTISHYYYLKRLPTFGGPAWQDEDLHWMKGLTLEQFLSDETDLAVDIVDLQTKYLGKQADQSTDGDDPASALNDLCDYYGSKPLPAARRLVPQRADLERAQERLAQAAFFGITERFQDSLFLLSFTFGWPPIHDSLCLNHTAESRQAKAVDPQIVRLIQSKVLLDSELYAFARHLFDERFKEMIQQLVARYGDHLASEDAASISATKICDLLWKHYEHRRNSRNRTLLSSIGASYLYSPSSRSEGALGWHGLQTVGEHGAARWSGPGIESTLDLPRPRGTGLRISFRVLMAMDAAILEQLSLSADGTLVPLSSTRDPMGAVVFEGVVLKGEADELPQPFVRLTFSVPKTVVPRDVWAHNSDPRSLGFLLNWVKLEALEQPPSLAAA